MSLSAEDIRKLGQLARLKLTDKEIAQYRTELGGILRYVDQLQQAKIPPIKKTAAPASSSVRPDTVKAWPEDERVAALKQAPDCQGEQVRVKRILG